MAKEPWRQARQAPLTLAATARGGCYANGIVNFFLELQGVFSLLSKTTYNFVFLPMHACDHASTPHKLTLENQRRNSKHYVNT
jgi:hypothetical protein